MTYPTTTGPGGAQIPPAPVLLVDTSGAPYAAGANASAYQLFTARTTTGNGASTGPVTGGSYLFTGDGTFGGGTLKLQRLAQDGATWVDIAGASMTAVGSVGVVIGQGAMVRAVLTGATSPNLYANLS
jgi:hypothetical protein